MFPFDHQAMATLTPGCPTVPSPLVFRSGATFRQRTQELIVVHLDTSDEQVTVQLESNKTFSKPKFHHSKHFTVLNPLPFRRASFSRPEQMEISHARFFVQRLLLADVSQVDASRSDLVGSCSVSMFLIGNLHLVGKDRKRIIPTLGANLHTNRKHNISTISDWCVWSNE